MERHLWQKDKYINVDQNVNIRTRQSLLGFITYRCRLVHDVYLCYIYNIDLLN